MKRLTIECKGEGSLNGVIKYVPDDWKNISSSDVKDIIRMVFDVIGFSENINIDVIEPDVHIFEKLHTHPKLEAEKQIDPEHVIVDKEAFLEAKILLDRPQSTLPLDTCFIKGSTFEKLIRVLEFYGTEVYYGAKLRAERLEAKAGDNDTYTITATNTALGKDKGEAARSLLKELTNKK